MDTKEASKKFQNGNWQDNAILSNGYYSWDMMADGYFNAANILVGSTICPEFINEEYLCCKNKEIGEHLFSTCKNTFIFPIFFLYRHYIELSIKKAYMRIKKCKLENSKIKAEHSLRILFKNLKDNYMNMYNSNMYQMYKNLEFKQLRHKFPEIEQTILEFDAIDSTSFNFRYPIDNNGCLIFNNNEIINIENLAEKMQKIRVFFQYLDIALDEIEEVKNIILDYIE